MAVPRLAVVSGLLGLALASHALAGSASKSQVQHPDDPFVHSEGSLVDPRG